MKSFILILSLMITGMDHDIHVSICDFTYQEDKGKVEVSIKVFYDDLLNAVGLKPGEELPEDYTSADDLINAFVNENLKIKINGEEKSLDYLESISYPPAVWTTFIIDQPKPIRQISMKNTLLTDLFDDQVNMVNLRLGKKKKVYSLDVKNTLLDLNI